MTEDLRLLFNDPNTGGWDLRGRREILLDENDGVEIRQSGRRAKNLTGEWRPKPKSRAVGNCAEDRDYIDYDPNEDEHNYKPEDAEKCEFRYFRNLALFETRPYERSTHSCLKLPVNSRKEPKRHSLQDIPLKNMNRI